MPPADARIFSFAIIVVFLSCLCNCFAQCVLLFDNVTWIISCPPRNCKHFMALRAKSGAFGEFFRFFAPRTVGGDAHRPSPASGAAVPADGGTGGNRRRITSVQTVSHRLPPISLQARLAVPAPTRGAKSAQTQNGSERTLCVFLSLKNMA